MYLALGAHLHQPCQVSGSRGSRAMSNPLQDLLDESTRHHDLAVAAAT